MLGCSVDSRWSHLAWKNTDINNGGIGKVNYPLLQDLDKSIARNYDVLVGTTDAYVETENSAETTTVEILEGLIEPSSGTATIANLDVVKDSKNVKKKTNPKRNKIVKFNYSLSKVPCIFS